MLKRRLMILSFLLVAFVSLSSSANRQTSFEDCRTGTDAFGNCVMICCDPEFGCWSQLCP